jgi:hypothetical protein
MTRSTNAFCQGLRGAFREGRAAVLLADWVARFYRDPLDLARW